MSTYNKELFSDLVIKSKGTRSLNRYALDANIDSGYLSRIVNLKRDTPPSAEIIKKLAKVAENNVNYTDFMVAAGYITITKLNDANLDDDNDTSPSSCMIPIYKSSFANLDENKKLSTPPYIYIDKSEISDGIHYYITVPDDSMIHARIRTGDLALIKEQTTFSSGDIVLVCINKGKETLRRIYNLDGQILLVPECSELNPTLHSNTDLNTEGVFIIGKVVHIKFKL